MIDTLGVYGGTFSPPHCGHYHAAEAFIRAINPDRLLIIPTYIPPHKTETDGVTAADRLNMCRIAFSGLSGAVVSDMEIRRGGKSYTSDTLRALAGTARRIAMLVGTDMMLALDTWHEPETVFGLADLYCVRREDDPQLLEQIQAKNEQYFKAYGRRVHLLTAPPLEATSTEIRKTLAKGEPGELLDPRVLAYIRERGLYAGE